jgi:cellulose synthase/poly-beta-1,6-N-acetylglucosamine synthase-like glycosyltransferase
MQPTVSSTLKPRRRERSVPVRWLGTLLLAFEGTLTLSTGYLLLLLAAARGSATSEPDAFTDSQHERLRFVVLIPAHDEESGIGATLRSLENCRYPREARRIIVIADNCTDHTADRARAAGAEAWERVDPAQRGKGFALAWALERLEREGKSFDAVVMLDADCLASPNMLSTIDVRLRSGARALQVNYVAGNPEASNASALRFAGFALMNTVRFQGKQRLGLSVGLVGTGMAFTRELLEREPWMAMGLTEDGEYHMRLVLAGERAEFVPDAWVSSAMPTALRNNSSEERWEQGKLQLIRNWSPRLLLAGLARRDVVRVHAALECLVPPQSLIAAGGIGGALAGLLLRSRRLLSLSLLTLFAQLAFVLAGLRLVRAPARVYRALLIAPALIVRKTLLYTRLLRGRGPTAWVRAERETGA